MWIISMGCLCSVDEWIIYGGLGTHYVQKDNCVSCISGMYPALVA